MLKGSHSFRFGIAHGQVSDRASLATRTSCMWKSSIVEVKDRVYGLDVRLVGLVMFQLGQVDY